jgi:hypothetical protein
LAWLADQLHAHASRPITYRPGAQQVALNATLGRKDFEADTHEGRLYIRGTIFCVAAADLVLGGQPTLPERGDQIDVSFDGTPRRSKCWARTASRPGSSATRISKCCGFTPRKWPDHA